jgi:hypothetical protein
MYSFVEEASEDDSGTADIVYIYTAFVKVSLKVTKMQWYEVAFQLCDVDDATIGTMSGQVEFRNPYGYVPAENYGMIALQVHGLIVHALIF